MSSPPTSDKEPQAEIARNIAAAIVHSNAKRGSFDLKSGPHIAAWADRHGWSTDKSILKYITSIVGQLATEICEKSGQVGGGGKGVRQKFISLIMKLLKNFLHGEPGLSCMSAPELITDNDHALLCCLKAGLVAVKDTYNQVLRTPKELMPDYDSIWHPAPAQSEDAAGAKAHGNDTTVVEEQENLSSLSRDRLLKVAGMARSAVETQSAKYVMYAGAAAAMDEEDVGTFSTGSDETCESDQDWSSGDSTGAPEYSTMMTEDWPTID